MDSIQQQRSMQSAWTVEDSVTGCGCYKGGLFGVLTPTRKEVLLTWLGRCTVNRLVPPLTSPSFALVLPFLFDYALCQ